MCIRDRTSITKGIDLQLGLREPTKLDVFKEKKLKASFAEIPRMSEPIVIGCPEWDKYGVVSSKHQLEIMKLGITVPTILPEAKSSLSDRVLRLCQEALTPDQQGVFELPCVIDVRNDKVRDYMKSLKSPWIRAGPQCPANIEMVEGPLRPKSLLDSREKIRINVCAYYIPHVREKMTPPSDGFLEVVERKAGDAEFEDVLDRGKTDLAEMHNDRLLM